MHSDEIARSFGFRGGLVPGVTIFSHLTRPLVAHHGEAWLARGTADVSFSKPAYEDELLTVRTAATTDDPYQMLLTCENEQGTALARMTAALSPVPAAPDPRGGIPPAPPVTERPEATWERMEIDSPFPALAWVPTREENLEWCRDVRDDLPLYREGEAPPLHPGFVLRQANLVLRNRFLLPAWIHTASRIRFFDVLRAGTAYEVRAIPEEKWRHKGHEFVRLFVALRRGERSVAEVLHTAIFRPRARGAESRNGQ
ncbi:MAG: hypothetical protein KIT18_06385 [Burkholderiales bacterium]|nr:hypothetical protein [Burkholderiales bacterium]